MRDVEGRLSIGSAGLEARTMVHEELRQLAKSAACLKEISDLLKDDEEGDPTFCLT